MTKASALAAFDKLADAARELVVALYDGAQPAPTPTPAPVPVPLPSGGNNGLALTKQGVVLRLGAPGEWDSGMIESPNVFSDGTQQIMLYVGYDASKVGAIGVATAPTLDGPWTKRGKILGGSGAGGDATGCTGPVGWFENGTYYLYYIGLNGGPGYESGNTGVYLATSKSLMGPYERKGIKISPTKGWRSNTIWHVNFVKTTKYFCFFNAGDGSTESIGYATSDSIEGPWTVDDVNSPLLRPGVKSAWDGGLIGDPYVYRADGKWYMAYYAVEGVNFGRASDGVATTTDDKFPLGWVKQPTPVLLPGPQYSYDEAGAAKPSIAFKGAKHYHFYASKGHVDGKDGVPAIGLATEG